MGLWTQNLVAFFGVNARADQVEEHATGRTAPAAIGEHETAGALGLQRLVEERLHPCGSKDTHGALQLFAGAGLGLPKLGGDLVDGDLVAGGGRVFCGWYSLSHVHTIMLAGLYPDDIRSLTIRARASASPFANLPHEGPQAPRVTSAHPAAVSPAMSPWGENRPVAASRSDDPAQRTLRRDCLEPELVESGALHRGDNGHWLASLIDLYQLIEPAVARLRADVGAFPGHALPP